MGAGACLQPQHPSRQAGRGCLLVLRCVKPSGAGAVLVGVCACTAQLALLGFVFIAACLTVSGGIRMTSGNATKQLFLPFYFMHRKFLAFTDSEQENRSVKGRSTGKQMQKQVFSSVLNEFNGREACRSQGQLPLQVSCCWEHFATESAGEYLL